MSSPRKFVWRVWLTNLRVGVPDSKPGHQIHSGYDTLHVVEVRADQDMPILVVRSRR
jgi:hypothetical protein